MSDTMSDTILGSIHYVNEDKTTNPNEKGYILHCAAPDGFPQNNFSIEAYKNIKIQSLRTANLSWEEHCTKVAPINSSGMTPEKFDDD